MVAIASSLPTNPRSKKACRRMVPSFPQPSRASFFRVRVCLDDTDVISAWVEEFMLYFPFRLWRKKQNPLPWGSGFNMIAVLKSFQRISILWPPGHTDGPTGAGMPHALDWTEGS